MNVIHGRGIISWAAVDTSRSDSQCDELIGFVTARVVTASECEVSLCILDDFSFACLKKPFWFSRLLLLFRFCRNWTC